MLPLSLLLLTIKSPFTTQHANTSLTVTFTKKSPAQEKYPCSDANGTNFWKSVVEIEQPDVFVFTGDNVCGGDIFGGKSAIDGLLADFVKADAPLVPWLAVEGVSTLSSFELVVI
jgi:hypothetical protein